MFKFALRITHEVFIRLNHIFEVTSIMPLEKSFNLYCALGLPIEHYLKKAAPSGNRVLINFCLDKNPKRKGIEQVHLISHGKGLTN